VHTFYKMFVKDIFSQTRRVSAHIVSSSGLVLKTAVHVLSFTFIVLTKTVFCDFCQAFKTLSLFIQVF
jgi:hypothetical protein